MKKILMLATGGTIATLKTDEGKVPQLTSQELLRTVPEIREICQVDTRQLFQLDSTNVHPDHWKTMARAILDHYDEFDGFVITHGTDTMAYTAAALSYMLPSSRKPIVLTGAQNSIGDRETDGRRNLLDAFLYAASSCAWGVTIVFDGQVMLGTRAKKLRTKSYHAFSSIGYPEVARIRDKMVYPVLPKPQELGKPAGDLRLDPSVFVLKLIPGIRPDVLTLLRPAYHALIVEGFGVGGVPYYATADFAREVGAWIEAGKVVIMTTQVIYEGSDMSVYQVGHQIKQTYGVIEAYDMTLEAVVTKTMHLLPQCPDLASFRSRFLTPVAHDILLPAEEPLEE